MGINPPPPPDELPPVLREFVLAIREMLAAPAAPFRTLNRLGESLRQPRSKQRLSDIARGIRLPEEHELRDLARACRSTEGPRLERLLQAAVAEETALAARRSVS